MASKQAKSTRELFDKKYPINSEVKPIARGCLLPWIYCAQAAIIAAIQEDCKEFS